MMTDLLNKFSVEGPYGQALHWWALGALVIVSISIVVLMLKVVLGLIARRIIDRDIDRLAILLVPSHFNPKDFVSWMFIKNAALENMSPMSIILSGYGTPLHTFIVQQLATKSMPELYDGVLNIPTKNADK